MPTTIDLSLRDRAILADLDAITEGVIERGPLARFLGVDAATVSRWWSGDRALPFAGLLAIGRRVVSGSQLAGARWIEAIAAGIGLRGTWHSDAPAAPASIGTVVELAQRAGDAARLLGDGVIACDEVDQANQLAHQLRAIAAQLDAAALAAALNAARR